MTLLDDALWSGRLFLAGWTAGSAGETPVVSPGSGQEIGRIGMAAPPDVAEAAKRAQSAQEHWASLPAPERAAVLRRAGDLWAAHSGELEGWLVRETGSTPAKAHLETHVAAEECYEAAALPTQPNGEVIPSGLPRLSLVRRVPAGAVGVIAPFNFPLILSIRSVAPALALAMPWC